MIKNVKMVWHWLRNVKRRTFKLQDVSIKNLRSSSAMKKCNTKINAVLNYVNIQKYEKGNARRWKLAQKGENTRNVNVIVPYVRVSERVPRFKEEFFIIIGCLVNNLNIVKIKVWSCLCTCWAIFEFKSKVRTALLCSEIPDLWLFRFVVIDNVSGILFLKFILRSREKMVQSFDGFISHFHVFPP